MRILIYSHAFAPQIGGVETYVMLLARGLASRKAIPPVQVTVATLTPKGAFDDSTLPFRVVRRPGFFRLAGLIRNADVIQLAGPLFSAMFLSWFMRKTVVVAHHGYPPICPNGLLFYEPAQAVCPGHFRARRYRECLRCNAVTVGWLKSLSMLLFTFPRRRLSKKVAANVSVSTHLLARLELPRSQVIYTGIADASLDGQPQRGSHPPGSPLIFAYLGRLVTLKGLSLILHAAERLQDERFNFRVKFIGDGPELAQLKSLAAKLGLSERVEFTGFLSGAALDAAMNEIAVVLMPSIWEETAGLSAIEQMMRGRLVIGSDIGGLGEVVGDAGLRFPPGDAEALARCMKSVLDHPGEIARLGVAARRRALQLFSEQRMVDEYLEVYKRVAQPASAPAGKARLSL
ncbi:MAG: glycosyltransferase family 4 protein [Candidatus Acidiferrales bacterium]